MNNKVFYQLVMFAFMAVFICCEVSPDNPLVGSWVEAVNLANQNDPIYSRNCYPEGPDAGYDGTWLFEKDNSYQLEFWVGTIAGSNNGYSSGTYELVSDSILILDVAYFEYQDSVYDVDSMFPAGADTHIVTITEDMLIDHHTVCSVYWRKVQ